MLQPLLHYSLHFLAPALIAYIFFRPVWLKAWLLMLLTMAVDLDHLLATPVFEPGRCSIGFHPLHTLPAIFVYAGMLFYPNRTIRILGLGLLFHMFTDFTDCLMTFRNCQSCCESSGISGLCGWWLS